MAADEKLLARVADALSHVREVEQKKMFGGITFMVRGRMCVSVGANRIMCRIDPAKHDAALQRKGSRTVVMKGREYRGYVHVDAGAVTSKRDLDYWVDSALEYNAKSAKPAAARKKKKA